MSMRVEGSSRGSKTIRRYAVLGLFLLSCGGVLGEPSTGGESHFLRYCESSCDSGLDCISGVCTRSCLLPDASCSDLSGSAVCTDASIEPGAVAVCDVACQGNEDCAELGTAYRCDAGFCRSGQPSGGAGGSGGSGSSMQVYECPQQVDSDPIDVQSAFIIGDTITLEVGHSGGCAEHTYALCYGPEFLESYPVQVGLTVVHDGHGDACEAYLQTTLSFDLSPLGAAYNAAYNSAGGIISTPYGLYGFGRALCEERQLAAGEQALDAAERADASCSSAQDCQRVSLDTRCSVGCGTLVSDVGAEELSQALATINESVCGDYEADGCTPPPLPPCAPPPPVDCVQGRCVESP